MSFAISTLIISAMFITCFAIGAFYIDTKSILHTITFILTVIVLWRKKLSENIKMIGLGVVIGFIIVLLKNYI